MMREQGDILLISCYELGHQPFNLASPLAVLKEAGYRPIALDSDVEALSTEAIAQAHFVGIAVPMHTAMRLGVHVAERVHAINADAHVCFYGLYATLNADYLLRHYADSVISGEYEASLLELIEGLEREPSPVNGHRAPEPNVDKISFAVPNRESLPSLEEYAAFQQNGSIALAGYTEATRGCLHTCRHCPITPIYGGRFFVVPRDVVMADIRQQVEMGAQHITFGDPDFFNGPGHTVEIARQMHEEFPHVTFDATIKVEHILEFRHYIPKLKELGCAFIVSAVEATSNLVLEKLKKDHTKTDIVEALEIVDDAGIPLRPSLVAFTPWTTMDDYLEMLHFVERQGLIRHVDPVQYSIRLLIPPNSAILDLPDTEEWLGPLDAENYTYRWDHPDPRMDELHQDVSELVEDAARAGVDSLGAFYEIKALAASTAGASVEIPAADERPDLPEVPHLTEAWFC